MTAQPDTRATGSRSKGTEGRLNFLKLQVLQAVLQPPEAGKPLPRARGTMNGPSRLSAEECAGCRTAFSQRPCPRLSPVFREWQLDVMARRHQCPESSSEIHRGGEGVRETTPESREGARLVDDPPHLELELAPRARLRERSQPRRFLAR